MPCSKPDRVGAAGERGSGRRRSWRRPWARHGTVAVAKVTSRTGQRPRGPGSWPMRLVGRPPGRGHAGLLPPSRRGRPPSRRAVTRPGKHPGSATPPSFPPQWRSRPLSPCDGGASTDLAVVSPAKIQGLPLLLRDRRVDRPRVPGPFTAAERRWSLAGPRLTLTRPCPHLRRTAPCPAPLLRGTVVDRRPARQAPDRAPRHGLPGCSPSSTSPRPGPRSRRTSPGREVAPPHREGGGTVIIIREGAETRCSLAG